MTSSRTFIKILQTFNFHKKLKRKNEQVFNPNHRTKSRIIYSHSNEENPSSFCNKKELKRRKFIICFMMKTIIISLSFLQSNNLLFVISIFFLIHTLFDVFMFYNFLSPFGQASSKFLI
jgi:hypothetical protein